MPHGSFVHPPLGNLFLLSHGNLVHHQPHGSSTWLRRRAGTMLGHQLWNDQIPEWGFGSFFSLEIQIKILYLLDKKLPEKNCSWAMKLFREEYGVCTVNFHVQCQIQEIWSRVLNWNGKLGSPYRICTPWINNLSSIFAVNINPPNSKPFTLPKWCWMLESIAILSPYKVQERKEEKLKGCCLL